VLRAAMVDRWIHNFAPQSEFHGLAVLDQGQFVAALPLVSKRVGKLIDVGGLPTGNWCASGDLLLDPSADADAVLSLLVDALDYLPWPLLWLDGVRLDADRWKRFQKAANQGRTRVLADERFRIGLLKVDDDWQTFYRNLSKNMRRNTRRNFEKANRQGKLQLECHRDIPVDHVREILNRGFEVEQRSWKSRQGTTITDTPGMADFLLRQSEWLAQQGHLQVAFLNCGGKPIAYELGWSAKHVYHSFKVSYDHEYADCSPGHMLFYLLLEQAHNRKLYHAFDLLGPITNAQTRWHPDTYRLGRLLVATPRASGRLLLHAYRHAMPAMRRWRHRLAL